MKAGRAKAWFFSGGIAFEVIAGIGALVLAILTPPIGSVQWPWLWAAIAALAYPLRMGAYYVLGKATTKPNMPGMLLVTAFALVMCGVSVVQAGVAPRLALAFAVAISGMAAALGYVFWYSRLGRTKNARLAAGARMPNVPFVDVGGKTVRAEELFSSRVLYLFYRGNWCPLCMAQIRDVAAQYRALDERGVRVAVVSPQPHNKTASLAKKLDVPMMFLEDRGLAAARELGIVHEGGLPAAAEVLGYEQDTVMPTVVLVDKGGVILWADETDNYRVRPEPATFLAVLDQIDNGDRVRLPAA